MIKLLILDKDGTLVRPESGAKFVQSPTDQVLLPGVKRALDRYAADGWKMAIASNQGDVAAKHKTLEQAIYEMRYCLHLTAPHIQRGCLCPDIEGFECYEVWRFSVFSPIDLGKEYRNYYGTFRKPKPGMLMYLISQFYRLSSDGLMDVLMVGDRSQDFGAALAAGVRFMWAHEWRGDRQG
ncbi:HAD-IIIA family hydrolase [Leptolyngbya sp. FACHB-16]|uniref:HAD-IIIA family hydrolase n=1 Tax=unclassified Leptolyngbya TaxID=2650499 RepID=UPI0016858C13|nr:HAD-IIIA family hydrolase [Leptolyngbya sp. FACHB-16]MBD2156267.1 HAD-IIIA family hydrolase [Leptolyngbya sp. FACHB-16]